MEKIKVYINDKEQEINDNSTIQDVLDSIGTKSPMFVVEKNLKIIPKEQYSSTFIEENDKIEIVSFFGGG